MKYRHIVMHNKLYFYRIKRINVAICRISNLSCRICVTTCFVKHFHISDFFDFVAILCWPDFSETQIRLLNEKRTDDSLRYYLGY